MWYRDNLGQQHPTQVVSVHLEDGKPYYGIAFGGATRDTEGYRLAPRDMVSHYVQGQEVWYRDKYGQWHPTQVISVHCDDTEPYYVIAYGNTTRDTVACRLATREDTSQVFEAAGE